MMLLREGADTRSDNRWFGWRSDVPADGRVMEEEVVDIEGEGDEVKLPISSHTRWMVAGRRKSGLTSMWALAVTTWLVQQVLVRDAL